MKTFARIPARLAALAGALFGAAALADGPVVIKVGTLHVGDGRTIQHGIVIVADGKITAVGAGIPIPSGATTIDLPSGAITPGLIDANAQIEPVDVVTRVGLGNVGAVRSQAAPVQASPGDTAPNVNPIALMFQSHDPRTCWSCSGTPTCAFANIHETLGPEQVCPCCGYPNISTVEHFVSGIERSVSLTEASSEVVPHTRVIDTMNLRSPDFERLVLGGVTTVFISPDSAAVIGPQGAVVRTAGPIMERIVTPASDVKAVMGTDSFTVGADNSPPFRGFVTSRTRRPNTRMGVTWVFRKSLYDTREWEAGITPSGADTPPTEAFPMLASVLKGSTPLRMQARMVQDIRTAVRLADEFNLKFTLLEANEGYKCLDLLKERKIPVIYGPLSIDAAGMRRFIADRGEARLSTVRELLDAGLDVALSAQDLREEDGLARQAMYAVRSGVTPAEAIKAITLTPAKMLGIDKDTGSIETGKRADLVVWSGEPLDATSRPLVVLIAGRTVMDLRDAAPKQ
jgi:imidazolonepropionase-like amidohydrolase